jgi:hypothetical protein
MAAGQDVIRVGDGLVSRNGNLRTIAAVHNALNQALASPIALNLNFENGGTSDSSEINRLSRLTGFRCSGRVFQHLTVAVVATTSVCCFSSWTRYESIEIAPYRPPVRRAKRTIFADSAVETVRYGGPNNLKKANPALNFGA